MRRDCFSAELVRVKMTWVMLWRLTVSSNGRHGSWKDQWRFYLCNQMKGEIYCLIKSKWIHWVARIATTKYQTERLTVLFSHDSGGQEFKIKVSVGLFCSTSSFLGMRLIAFLLWHFSVDITWCLFFVLKFPLQEYQSYPKSLILT